MPLNQMFCILNLDPPFASSATQLPCLCNGDNKTSSVDMSQNYTGST